MSKDIEAEISRTILTLRDRYVNDSKLENINNYWDINNGLCIEFAEDVIELLGGIDSELDGVTQDSFTCKSDYKYFLRLGYNWDSELLEKRLNIKPPDNITWEELRQLPFGDHYWIMYKNKFFDAECPEGISNFFKLPIFDRLIKNYISNKH